MQKFPRLVSLISAVFALSGATTAAGEGIDFEEIVASNDAAVVLSDEYAELGVRFVGTDGSVWHGITDGDPGGFGLEGTNGPSFLGFDGASFSTEIHFDSPVSGFALDLARGEGGGFHFFFLLQGFRDGVPIGLVSTILGPVGEWSELSLAEEVDHVSLSSIGNVRYGVDNLRWQGSEPSHLAVEIDIMPGSERNPLRLDRPGVVGVALFGAEGFDVADVDIDSLSFGPAGAFVAHREGPHDKDVDGDGLLDLLGHFRVDESGIGGMDLTTCLHGELLDGTPLEGCDVVTAVGRPRGRRR